MKSQRVVITGLGVVAPNGIGLEEFWSSILAGQSASDKLEGFEPNGCEVTIAAEVRSFNAEAFIPRSFLRKLDRFAQLGYAASKMALEDAGLLGSLGSTDGGRRIGVCVGSGLGGIMFHEDQIQRLITSGHKGVIASSIAKIAPNSVSCHIAIGFGLRGPNVAISTACSSGANAIGIARDWIRSGVTDVVVTGGVEAPITPTTFSAYAAMRVLSRRNDDPRHACRPFDSERDGFVLGEGSGIVILESLKHAQERGARIYAELKGFASNCGAYHMVTPDPTGADAATAMNDALEDAGIPKESVDHINAHGTGTIANDVAETKAITAVFGSRTKTIPVVSIKAVTGHGIGAAGAIECIASVLSLRDKVVPPTANYKSADPDCDLSCSHVSRSADINTVMSNSFGFGSNNAVLILTSLGASV